MTTFIGDELTIVLPSGLDGGILNIQDDLYEPWKDWVLAGNAQYPRAFDPSGGGDVTTTSQEARYYFIRNDLGWKIRPAEEDASFGIEGNLVPSDLTKGFAVPTLGGFTTIAVGLQPIAQAVSGLPTATEAAEAVWRHNLDTDTVLAGAGTELAGNRLIAAARAAKNAFASVWASP